MKKRSLRAALASGLIAFTAGVVGPASIQFAYSQEKVKTEKVLTIAVPFGPKSSVPDPRARQNGWLSNRAGVSETLVGLDYQMKMFPRLAESYRNVSPTQWEFTLRENVKFHDGSDLTAQQVKDSFLKLNDKDHSAYNPRLIKLLNIKEISVKDDRTLVFETNEPNSAFIWSLTEPTASVIKEGTDKLPIIGTGPFVFVSAEAEKNYHTKAFADYWGGKPKLDGIVMDAISDASVAALALKAGDVDLVTNYSEPDFAALEKSNQGQRFEGATTRLFFYQARTADGPLANKELRQAISLGLDRDLIVEAALAGVGGDPAHSIFPVTMESWVNQALEASYDRDKALEILDNAGLKDTNDDGIREIDGENIVLKLRSYEGRPALKPTLEVTQALLSKLGLKVEISMGEYQANNDALKLGEIHMHLQAWGTAPQGDPDYFPSTLLDSEAGYNFSGYNNPKLDALLEKGRGEFDPVKRKVIYDEIQEIIAEDLPLIPVFHKTQVSVGNGKVKGYRIHPAETYLASPELDIEG
ncbi:ABC transporter substrate-binding protein [Kiloniella litopenaei]|uniref:ABC transporter substrate-binding protein n=1 Tax=Kiloniella litopenaei TaxID=1549748 RepID=UPI0006989B22|nr:ABC transporter substrate-binding protein [Kiloniella litopenaei]